MCSASVQQFGQSPTIVRRAVCVQSAPFWLWKSLATLTANVKLVYLILRLRRRGEEGRTKRGWADRNTAQCPIDRRTGTGAHKRQEGMSPAEEKGGTDIERKLNRHDKLITAFGQLDFASSVLGRSDVTYAELAETVRRLLFTCTRKHTHALRNVLYALFYSVTFNQPRELLHKQIIFHTKLEAFWSSQTVIATSF